MNLVTDVFSSLKKSPHHDYLFSPEEIKQRNVRMLGIVDGAIDTFLQNLQQGKVKLKTSLDLERLVKLALILSEQITLNPKTTVFDDNVANSVQKLPDDPQVHDLYQKLYDRYNQQNDVD